MEQTTGPNFIGHEGGWSWAISANTQHLERALAYTNFMYSHDGIMRMRYGNPGPDMFWNLDANGMPYRTEASFDPDFTFADGSAPDEGISTLNNNGLMPREIHPAFGVTIDSAGWQVMPWAPQLDPLRQSWNSIMGVDDRGTIAWLRESGNLIERDFAPTLPLSEEMSALESRIADFTRTLSWQMVFARDQAEFDSLWREMVDRAEAMGVAEANAERAQLHMDALEFGARYMP